jgi:N utilization substance protein B
VLGLLYESEQKHLPLDDVVAGLPSPPEAYAVRLASGVASRLAEIDELVERYANDWALDRMPAVDRQLLRIAVYELIAEPTVPVAVIIDEAVDLAKIFSTDESGKFVNGVLAAVAARTRPGEVVTDER